MQSYQPPSASAISLPAADVSASTTAVESVAYEAYPVRKPEEELNDFIVQVRASTLTRCRTKLTQISHQHFPWRELALAISTLAAGAYLGTIPDKIKTGTFQSTIFHTVLPAIAAAAFVAYIFLYRSEVKRPEDTVSAVLNELPDPNKTR